MTNHIAPHQLLTQHRRLCLAAATVSVVLSLWALHVDPVVNNDGILYIEAAQYFSAGEWSAGFTVYKWPFYSFLVSAISIVTGLAAGHSAYLLNAALYVVLVLGFVAFVRALGGGSSAIWVAAAIALSHPVLNEFRSFIIRDIGYWACYVWSLAYFFAYLRYGRGNLLFLWLIFSALAFLFRIEGIVLVALLPACLYVTGTTGRHRTAALALLTFIGVLVVAVSPLWHYLSEIGANRDALATDPMRHVIESWKAGTTQVLSRLDALQREFTGITTKPIAFLVYLCTVLLIALTEVIKSLGIVFTGLAIYACSRITVITNGRQRRWWLTVITVQALLVFLFVLSSFFLAERYPVGLALAILAIVPLVIGKFWEERIKPGKGIGWRGATVAALLAIEAIEGLDLATEKQYIKDAGLWLRQNAAPDSTLYSNNRILVYYAGLKQGGTGFDRSLEKAMTEVWTGDWKTYDYFVLVMNKRDTRNEVLLLKKIGSKPLKTFTSERGDQVLVFHSG